MSTDRGRDYERLGKVLPGWRIVVGARGGWAAQDPGYPQNGLVVEADDPDELVERVRALVRVVALADDRAGRQPPQRQIGVLGPLTPMPLAAERASPMPAPAPTAYEAARERGFEGDPCPECGAMMMVRNGACLKCTACGSTSGCS